MAAVLDEDDVEEVLAAPRPDVAALASAHERALESVADAGARAGGVDGPRAGG